MEQCPFQPVVTKVLCCCVFTHGNQGIYVEELTFLYIHDNQHPVTTIFVEGANQGRELTQFIVCHLQNKLYSLGNEMSWLRNRSPHFPHCHALTELSGSWASCSRWRLMPRPVKILPTTVKSRARINLPGLKNREATRAR